MSNRVFAPQLAVGSVTLMVEETVRAASATNYKAPFLPLLLFLLRLSTRLLAFLDDATSHGPPPAAAVDTPAFMRLLECEVAPLLTRWAHEATLAQEYGIVAKIMRHLAFLHAMLARMRPVEPTDVCHVLGCMAYAPTALQRRTHAAPTQPPMSSHELP